MNRSDLVSQDIAQIIDNSTSPETPVRHIKHYREAIVRALTEMGGTRTWNLLIDVVAQSGKTPTGSTGLENFVIEGERRYWMHVAIDRFTGEIVDKKLEIVYE